MSAFSTLLRVKRGRPILLACLSSLAVVATARAEPRATLPVWPGRPPGETREWPPEADTTTADGGLVAGRRVIRLGNVSRPTLEVFKPSSANDTGTAVVICPGGGHRILAYDLEGTEVAEWLQSIGVTGIVLKYRVPARDEQKKWEAAVQDAQRAISVVRHQAETLQVDPQRIGVLGFSAGGQTAALASLMDQRQYEPIDEVDRVSPRPNFTVLVYPAYLADKQTQTLLPEATVTEGTPPMFLVHAYNDPVPVENSLVLCLGLKRAQVPAELHAFATGGHGFGLRPTDEPCTHWPAHCEQWLQRGGWLTRR
jgi:acetyl esterase/lipase